MYLSEERCEFSVNGGLPKCILLPPVDKLFSHSQLLVPAISFTSHVRETFTSREGERGGAEQGADKVKGERDVARERMSERMKWSEINNFNNFRGSDG